MQINVLANNNYIAFKQALKIVFGGKGSSRQVFKERKLYSLVFQDDVEETEYEFGDLNYKYIEEIPISDITVFNNEDYGKFFYEYGRVILANLMICLTKADWNSVSQLYNEEAEYVNKYFASLEVLDNHIDSVVEKFKKDYINESDYSEFNINYKKASEIIRCYKNEFASYKDSKDMKNSDIFYCAYIGLMFTIYGLINILSSSIDVSSFLKSPSSKSSLLLIKNILTGLSNTSGEDDEAHPQRHFISMVYAYYKMTSFYKSVSGYDKLDPMLGALFDLSENFISKFDVDDNVEEFDASEMRKLIDRDLIEESVYSSGINLQTFTSNTDPLLEFLQFKSGCILTNDNADIWDFGRVYLNGYNLYKTDEEYDSIFSDLNPVIGYYLKNRIKNNYSKEEMTRIFGIVSEYLSPNKIEEYSEINPGLILQLTIVASAFRSIEKQKSDLEINGAIDILDTLILKLYEMWFKSGKYFHQQCRPKYTSNDSCNSTLKYLKSEVDFIILTYLEFVRYGDTVSESDMPTFKSLKEAMLLTVDKEHLDEFINSKYPFIDPDTFVRLCAKREGRSIVQTVFENNTEFDFVNLISKYEHKELAKYYITNYANEPERHTGISIIDRAIDNSKEARNSSLSNPEIYIIAVIGIIWVYFEDIFRNKNIGNYFDFGDASSSLNSYKIEHIVTNSLLIPLKRKYNISEL